MSQKLEFIPEYIEQCIKDNCTDEQQQEFYDKFENLIYSNTIKEMTSFQVDFIMHITLSLEYEPPVKYLTLSVRFRGKEVGITNIEFIDFGEYTERKMLGINGVY